MTIHEILCSELDLPVDSQFRLRTSRIYVQSYSARRYAITWYEPADRFIVNSFHANREISRLESLEFPILQQYELFVIIRNFIARSLNKEGPLKRINGTSLFELIQLIEVA